MILVILTIINLSLTIVITWKNVRYNILFRRSIVPSELFRHSVLFSEPLNSSACDLFFLIHVLSLDLPARISVTIITTNSCSYSSLVYSSKEIWAVLNLVQYFTFTSNAERLMFFFSISDLCALLSPFSSWRLCELEMRCSCVRNDQSGISSSDLVQIKTEIQI